MIVQRISTRPVVLETFDAKLQNGRDHRVNLLRELKEHEHFLVTVASSGAASIVCKMCCKRVQLGMKDSRFLISNWTRHVGKCAEKVKQSDNHKYASPVTPSSSRGSSTETSSEQPTP